MISIKCPHCHIGLKIDETKIPISVKEFKCPKCKQPIMVSILDQYKNNQSDEITSVINKSRITKKGTITVFSTDETPNQIYDLHEGISVIGRKTESSNVTIGIITQDKLMSRKHIKIEVVKNKIGEYTHLLSDMNSKNKTMYNNDYMEKDEIIVLQNGDEITIGKTKLRFNE